MTERKDRIEQLERRLQDLTHFLEELEEDLNVTRWTETAREIRSELNESYRVLGIEGVFE